MGSITRLKRRPLSGHPCRMPAHTVIGVVRMYALVRYEDEKNNKYVVSAKDIKDFNYEEIDYTAIYSVFWKPPGGSQDVSHGDYYPAQILLVAPTEAELQLKRDEKRVRVPKLPQHFANPDKGLPKKKTAQLNFKPKEQQRLECHKSLTEILKASKGKGTRRMADSSDEGTSGEELISSSALEEKDEMILKLKNRCKRLATDKDNLRKVNETLTLALASQVLQLNRGVATASTNIQQQEAAPTVPPMPIAVSAVSPEVAVPKNSPSNNANGEIDLGGVFISAAKFEQISMGAKTPSMFCKELALTIWSPDEYKKRSVTGGVCYANSNAPFRKPPLTPQKVIAVSNALRQHLQVKQIQGRECDNHMKCVNKYLREKIADLNKKKP